MLTTNQLTTNENISLSKEIALLRRPVLRLLLFAC